MRANLNFMLTQTDMYRGAQAQSRFNLVDTPDGRMTRHLAISGKKPDVDSHPSWVHLLASHGHMNLTAKHPPDACAR